MRLSIFLVFLLLLVAPTWGEPLTVLQFRLLEPQGLDSASKTLYRVGKTRLRIETGSSISIRRGTALWDLDLKTKVASYTHDPDGEVRVWVFPPDELPENARDLELGYELNFIENNPFQAAGSEMVEGETCRRLDWNDQATSIQFWVDSENAPVQLEVKQDGVTVLKLRYDSYETFDQVDQRLFQLPLGYRTVGKKGDIASVSGVYEPWLGEVAHLYGNHFSRFAEKLEEDLAPTMARAQSNSTQSLAEALASDLKQAQWPALQSSCGGPVSPLMTDSLIRLSRQDPDSTDRAYAYRLLAQLGEKSALRAGLFDDYLSNRLLCAELLQEAQADLTILMPSKPLNPFHYHFLGRALERLIPTAKSRNFFSLPVLKRRSQVPNSDFEAHLRLAREYAQRPMAASVLFLFGEAAESQQALETIVEALLDQGGQKDVYHSAEFWLRGDLIQVLGASGDGGAILKIFEAHLKDYTPEKEMLLLALAYALDTVPAEGASESLARVRDLKTDNYDLYLAAAMALTDLDQQEALVSLLHVLSLEKQPFTTMAVLRLEKMTGESTPGWQGRGLYPDPNKAFLHWKNWARL